MTKTTNRTLDQLLRSQGDLMTRRQVLDCGVTEGEMRHKLRPNGPWTVVLPGVYLAHNGLLAAGQQEIAALLYAGRDSVISGRAALARHGVRVPLAGSVDVLVPHDRRLQSVSFVDVHRTKRLPEQIWRTDGLRWAPIARAVADATRDQSDLRAVRATVADAVQRGKCTIGQLIAELDAGPTRGSAPLRAALEEVAAGADCG